MNKEAALKLEEQMGFCFLPTSRNWRSSTRRQRGASSSGPSMLLCCWCLLHRQSVESAGAETRLWGWAGTANLPHVEEGGILVPVKLLGGIQKNQGMNE